MSADTTYGNNSCKSMQPQSNINAIIIEMNAAFYCVFASALPAASSEFMGSDVFELQDWTVIRCWAEQALCIGCLMGLRGSLHPPSVKHSTPWKWITDRKPKVSRMWPRHSPPLCRGFLSSRRNIMDAFIYTVFMIYCPLRMRLENLLVKAPLSILHTFWGPHQISF